jgi:carbonic anhydrase
MSNVLNEVIAANDIYAREFGDKANLAVEPIRKFAVLTCMDARLDPAKYAGLSEGDAHVIRNAGGFASDDAIRSLLISHMLLGTEEWFIIHHTQCGMQSLTDEKIREVHAISLETARMGSDDLSDVGSAPGSHESAFIDWLVIHDPAKSVVADVERVRSHPLVPKSLPIYGYTYDVKTGKLSEVPEATLIGRAS